MTRRSLGLALTLLLVAAKGEEKPALPAGGAGVRFTFVDLFADSPGKGLAAYQVEIVCDPSRSTIVGVEGGETRHYAEPPHYDPAALHNPGGGRIILAAFTTEDDPPAGRVRVARLHFQETGVGAPQYSARLMAAAAPGGERIEAKIEVISPGGSR